MFDKDANKPLQGTEKCTVQHNGPLVPTPIFIHITNIKPLRQVHIDLQGATLPIPTNGVAQYELKLRTVEGALSREEDVVQAHNIERITECALELVPNFVTTNAVLGASR